MTHSDVIIGHVVTSSVKLHQEAPLLWVLFDLIYSTHKNQIKFCGRLISILLLLNITVISFQTNTQKQLLHTLQHV